MHTDERKIATFQTTVKTTGWGVRLTFLAKNNRDSFKISRQNKNQLILRNTYLPNVTVHF